MQSLPFLRSTPFNLLRSLPPKPLSFQSKLQPSQSRSSASPFPPFANKGPRGFGPVSQKKKSKQRRTPGIDQDDDDDDDDNGDGGDDGRDDDGGTIPEIVTDRMMRRMGLSVGIPLVFGLLFFPLFYYLKVVAKIDVPTWIPVIVSLLFFGVALLGVSYGIVSASWDPLREGSLLGWNEARRNWPVFWESLRGGKK